MNLRVPRFLLILAVVLTGLLAGVQAQTPGALDPTFDGSVTGAFIQAIVQQPDGKVLIGGSFSKLGLVPRTNFGRLNADGTFDGGFGPPVNNDVNAILVQRDGKMVIGGAFTTVVGVPVRGLARINTDGSLDSSFMLGVNGSVTALATQPDGKILVAGPFASVGGTGPGGLARINADGTLDSGFNVNLGVGAAYSVAVEADGNILIAGHFNDVGGTPRMGLARLSSTGSLVSAFDVSFDDFPETVAVQGDGKILIGGGFTTVNGVSRPYFARLNANGSLDTAFNVPLNQSVHSIALQTDGRIVIAGNFTSAGGATRVGLARVNSDGSLDAGFNPASNNAVYALCLQADGSVLAGGTFTSIGGGSRSLLARLHNDPAPQVLTSPDSTQVTWARSGSAPEAVAVTFELSTDAGSNWTLLGAGTRVGSTSNWQLTGLSLPGSGQIRAQARTSGGRFNGSTGLAQQIDDFGPAGSLGRSFTTAITNGTWINTIAAQPDGKTLIGGRFIEINGVSRYNLARLNADGSVDAAFDPQVNADVYSLAVQPDGKILVGGFYFNIGGVSRTCMARLNADGSLDTEFQADCDGIVQGILVQPDGQIVLFGTFSTVSGVTRNRIARLNPDGGVDSGFNPNPNNFVSGVALQDDGKILVGGIFTSIGGASRSQFARLNTDGTADTNFSAAVNNSVSAIVVQGDGKIVIGGAFDHVSGSVRNFLARLNSDGSLDAGYDPNGNNQINSMVLQADGKVLVGGTFTSIGGATHNGVARIGTNGTVEGLADTNVAGEVKCLALQSDGRVLIGGAFTSVGGIARNFLARLNGDTATQTVSAADHTQARWTRSGTAPAVSQVAFERSGDGGTTWTPLGNAVQIAGTASWQLTGLDLPANGLLRARGRVNGSLYNGSSGVIEQLATYSVPTRPTVTTTSATGVGTTGVTLNATVSANNASTSVEFQYSTSSSVDTNVVTTSPPAGLAGDVLNGAVAKTVNGLAPHTAYFYKAVATNSQGSTAGGIVSVTTANSQPSAPDDSFSFNSGEQRTITLNFPTSDADGDPVVIESVSASAPVTARVSGTNGVNITLASSFAGKTSFTYTVSDGFGGTATGTVGLFVTDAQAPDTVIGSAPDARTKDSTVSISFSGTDNLDASALTFEGSLDGGAYAAVTSPYITPTLSEGSHTFSVRAIDAAGNVDATPAQVSWFCDFTPPQISIASKPALIINSTTANFTFGSLEFGVTYSLRLDGGSFAATPATTVLGNLSEGLHTVYVRGSDAVGNQTVTPLSYTFEVRTQVATSGLFSAGDDVPGAGSVGGAPAGATFTGFGIPSINDAGQVAFLGKWTSPSGEGAGIFAGNPAALVVKVGDTATGAATFAALQDPVLSASGKVLFGARLTGTGITSANDGALFSNCLGSACALVAQEGATAEVSDGAKLGSFQGYSLKGQEVLYVASLKGGKPVVSSANNRAAYRVNATGTSRLVRTGQSAADFGLVKSKISGFSLFGAITGSPSQNRNHAAEGEVNFLVLLADGRNALINDVQGVRSVLAKRGDHPAGADLAAATFKSFTPVSTTDGSYAAFLGTLTAGVGGVSTTNASGIFYGSGPFVAAARSGGATGIRKVTFGNFKPPVNSGVSNDFAFAASLKGSVTTANDTALFWRSPAGTLALLAREGANPPGTGTGVKWALFKSLAFSSGAQGGPLFYATLLQGSGGVNGSNDAGLWATDSNHELRLLLRENDPFLDHKIKNITVLTGVAGSPGVARSFNNAGQVVCRVTLSGGTQSLLKIQIP